MTNAIEAVYEGGVFRPTHQIALSEGTRVEVFVPVAATARNAKKVAVRLSEIAAKAARTGRLESTSQDHDRYLYGKQESP